MVARSLRRRRASRLSTRRRRDRHVILHDPGVGVGDSARRGVTLEGDRDAGRRGDDPLLYGGGDGLVVPPPPLLSPSRSRGEVSDLRGGDGARGAVHGQLNVD